MMKKLLFGCMILLSYTSFGQDFTELMKAVAEDRDTEDRFGWSADIDGDFAIVGAYGDDYGATNPNMGSAYIFQRIGGEWIEIQKLSNSDQDDYDRFGWSVAIDGDFAIVGAYGEDHNLVDAESLSKAGSAYVFERGGDGVWTEVQKLIATDRAEADEFGWSVAIHGTTAVVGAHNDDKNEDGFGYFYHAGSAYIFDREVDGSWTQTQKIVASDRGPGTVFDPGHEDWNARFGESVAIWNDYVVVGGPFSSKAYVYERSGGSWTEVSYLIYPGLSSFDRAAPVSIDSTTIVLGAQTEDLNADLEDYIMNSGGAAVFKRITGTWEFTQKLSPSDRDAGDHFGISVTVDGNYIAVGAHSDNHDEDGGGFLENTGSVFLYELQDDGTYLEIIKLDASDRAMDDELGISVSMSEGTLISGAWQQDLNEAGGSYLEDAGSVYFYTNLEGGGGDICETVFYTQDVELCAGGSVEVGEHVYSETGIYTDVILTDAGCDSIVTTILNVADEIMFEQFVALCFGGSVHVGDNIYTTTGTYVDVFETDEGCDSIVFTYLTVEDEMNTDVEVTDAVLEAELAGATYQWITCDPTTIIDGATSNTYTAEESGNYAVIITIGECTDTSDCYTVEIIDDSGIEDNQFASISIYPNPTNGLLTITGKNITGSQLEIYSSLGQLVAEKTINSNNELVNLTEKTAGIYILKITNNNGAFVQKITLK